MTKLSVNVNKLATLRNSRGKNNPNVLETALRIIDYGAEGITVHPRPDERHIRFQDVRELRPAVKKKNVEFNIEGYPSKEYLDLIKEVKPEQATLVPDPPEAITSNAGWKLESNVDFLTSTVAQLKKSGTRVSLFMDPRDYNEQTVPLLKQIATDRIELYTEEYALSFGTPQQQEVTEIYHRLAQAAHTAGIGINAGHDLDRKNLNFLIQSIPFIAEVSIGHALICDALELGLQATIREYLDCLA